MATLLEMEPNQFLELKSGEILNSLRERMFSIGLGNVTIDLRTRGNPKSIQLYSQDLNISSVKMLLGREFPLPLTYMAEGDILTIKGHQALKDANIYSLYINFRGWLRDELYGFYRSKYESGNKFVWFASTHFEAQHARKAFPCFDEPHLRATFELDITIKNYLNAVANTPQQNVIPNDYGWKTILFRKAPAMPIYLVGWAIYDGSSYVNKSLNYSNEIYRVFSRDNVKMEMELALNNVRNVIKTLENYTGISYFSEMDKLDLLAVPELPVVAMENWGIVTFSEDILLYNKNKSTTVDEQNILTLIAHELSHQWFGNLVTVQWWSNTWLSEGFARYFQYIITDKLETSWNMLEQFVINVLQVSMKEDSLKSHTLTMADVSTPLQIENMFDTITYDKGASIIRMLCYIAGEDKFKIGINTYLQNATNSGGVAIPDFLWWALEKIVPASRLPKLISLKTIMESWTENPGFPIVHVKSDGDHLVFHQSVYEWNANISGKWWVPIILQYGGNYSLSHPPINTWLGPESWLIIKAESIGMWYLVNTNQTGYYKVNYDEKNWKALTQALKNHTQFSPLTRAQLINDALTLLLSNHLPSNISLGLIGYLASEIDFLPWKSALSALDAITDYFVNSKNLPTWKEFVQNLLDGVLLKTNFEISPGDNHIAKLKKMTLLKAACKYGHRICQVENLEKLKTNNLHPDLEGIILCTSLQNGSDPGWLSVYSKYMISDIPTEKQMLLDSLSCTDNKKNLVSLLEKSLRADYIKRQNFFNLISSICTTPLGATTTLQFVKDNYNEIIKYIGGSKRSILRIMPYIVKRVQHKEELNDIEAFLLKTPGLKFSSEIVSAIISTGKDFLHRRRTIETEVCTWLGCSYEIL